MNALAASGVGLVAALVALGILTMGRRARWTGTMIAATMGVLSFSTPAFAVTNVQNTTWPVYTENAGCLQQHIYLDNSSGHPHMDSYLYAAWVSHSSPGTIYDVATPCGTGQTWLGYAQLQDTQDLFVLYLDGWNLCNQGPWVPNAYHSAIASTGYNFYYPCGRGLYYFPEAYGMMNGGNQYLIYPSNSLYVN